MEKSLLEYALAYQELGWSVIPLKPRDKRPLLKSWLPFQKKTASKEQITKWWKKWPTANIGIVTGKVSDIIAIDIDSAIGQEAYRTQIGNIPSTIRQTTGKENAMHLLFKHNGTKITNFAKVIDDVDIRGDGGYIVAAPSIHKNGNQYKWIIDPTDFGLDDLLDIPERLTKTLTTENGSKPKNPDNWVSEALWGVKKGKRDVVATKLAGYYLRLFKGDIEQTVMILNDWDKKNDPPMGFKRLEKCILSIHKRQGEEELSDTIGEPVASMEIYRYPDGDKTYKVYLADHPDPVILNDAKDIVSHRNFKIAVCRAVDKVIPSMKADVWEPMINKILVNAVKIDVPEEETIIGTIRGFIDREVTSKSVSDDLSYVENRVVVEDNIIYLRLDVILRSVCDLGNKLSAKQCGNILRKNMGFEYKQARIGTKQLRIYQIDKKQWKLQLIEAY